MANDKERVQKAKEWLFGKRAQTEPQDSTAIMDEKARQWLRDNPTRRYLMDVDANDIDNFDEQFAAGKAPDGVTDPEEAKIISHGHRRAILDSDYEPNMTSNGRKADRSDEYVPKGTNRRSKVRDVFMQGLLGK